MGESGEDIKLSHSASKLLALTVECKAQEKIKHLGIIKTSRRQF